MTHRNPGEPLPEYVERVLRQHFPNNRHFAGIVQDYLDYLSDGIGNKFLAESSARWFKI